jgi:hypothetical protein
MVSDLLNFHVFSRRSCVASRGNLLMPPRSHFLASNPAVRYFTEQHEMQLQTTANVKTIANLVKMVRSVPCRPSSPTFPSCPLRSAESQINHH